MALDKRERRLVGRHLKKRAVENLSEEEVQKLSKDIKIENARIVGFGTFSVNRKELKGNYGRGKTVASLASSKSEDDLYKEWVKYSAGVKTGDDKPLDSKEAFKLHFDSFLAFVKQQQLDEQEKKFAKFIKANSKGKKGSAAIRALSGCLRWAVAQSPKITAGQLITLLSVAENQGQKLSYYVDATFQNKSTVSRHMLEMGLKTEKYAGLEWIEVRDHPTDNRAKEFYLTPKGLQFISHIDQQMSMPFDENNLLSSVLGIPMPIKSSFNVTAKATVITKEDREREAKLAQKKAEAAAKYKFLNN